MEKIHLYHKEFECQYMPFQYDHQQYKYENPRTILLFLNYSLIYERLIKLINQNDSNTTLN